MKKCALIINLVFYKTYNLACSVYSSTNTLIVNEVVVSKMSVSMQYINVILQVIEERKPHLQEIKGLTCKIEIKHFYLVRLGSLRL